MGRKYTSWRELNTNTEEAVNLITKQQSLCIVHMYDTYIYIYIYIVSRGGLGREGNFERIYMHMERRMKVDLRKTTDICT